MNKCEQNSSKSPSTKSQCSEPVAQAESTEKSEEVASTSKAASIAISSQTGPELCLDDTLRERLSAMLVCVICQQLPKPDAGYSCFKGHIMCQGCLYPMWIQALESETLIECPKCEHKLLWSALDKNLVMRQMLAEFPQNDSNAVNSKVDSESGAIDFLDMEFHLESENESDLEIPFYFETNKFLLLGHQWMLRANIERMGENLGINIEYVLIMMTIPEEPINIKYFLAKTPISKIPIEMIICEHTFTQGNLITEPKDLILLNKAHYRYVLERSRFDIRVWLLANVDKELDIRQDSSTDTDA